MRQEGENLLASEVTDRNGEAVFSQETFTSNHLPVICRHKEDEEKSTLLVSIL